MAMACNSDDVGLDEFKCDFFEPIYKLEGLMRYSFEKVAYISWSSYG